MSSDQQKFWAGDFGNEYIKRNESPELLASNLNFFSRIFAGNSIIPKSFIEFGANIGMNARALKLLFPNSRFVGVEINEQACKALREVADQAILGAFETVDIKEKYDVSFSKGVLIHLNPNSLEIAYDQLYSSSNRLILLAEYYNPVPTSIPYRGYEEKLFKRDFAGEFMDRFKDVRLVNYGFSYHKDIFPQDDITWFLLEKK